MSWQKTSLCVLGLPLGTQTTPPFIPDCIRQADVLCGFPKTLKAFASLQKPCVPLTLPLDVSLQSLTEFLENGQKVVILASGDPLFYGIGATLPRYFPKDSFTILPSVSSLQETCAKIAMPWHDVVCVSLHGRKNTMALNQALLSGKTICLLTDPSNTPKSLAAYLAKKGYPCTIHVFANIGTPKESYSLFSLLPDPKTAAIHVPDIPDIAPNIPMTILLEPSKKPTMPMLGIPEALLSPECYCTKAAVRATALSLLAMRPNEIFWDIGAGSGALSLEACRLLPEGAIFAVEEKAERMAIIEQHLQRFGAYTVNPVAGHAPLCLKDLPNPTRVFVGGGLSQNDARRLLDATTSRMAPSGRIVLACVLLQTIALCHSYFQKKAWTYGVTLVQTSSSTSLANDLRFGESAPVYLVWAEKPNTEQAQ
ncbi:MAG: precorrin-6y C5,15-methyltransferase (decarboxylating) subunit CbiE [Desulfovibrio sp.]|nr:precorrin-6y C5,15-methyltransferase (decarboxylating) subunit CbiE [Desulfovibrio sp.]